MYVFVPLLLALSLAHASLLSQPAGGFPADAGVRTGTAEPPASRIFRMERLAAGVWAALVVERPDAYAFANSLVVLGDDGVLVVDTQQSPTAAGALIAWIRERTDAPVRWVVNTHWHGDHVYGNQAYRAAFPRVQFVGHARLDEALAGPATEMLDEERSRIPELVAERSRILESGHAPGGEPLTDDERARLRYSLRVNERQARDLEDLRLVPPDVEVAAERRLEVGGREVRIRAVAPAHTGTDLVVHLPGEGIAAVGDLLEEGLPWIGEEASVRGWAAALDTVAAMKPAVVLPAHGGIHRDGRLLSAQRGLFRALWRQVSAAVSRQDDPETAGADVDLSGHRPTGSGAPTDEGWRRWVETAVERAREEARAGAG